MKTLKQIYPLFLLGMILFIQVIALLINYQIYDFRELIILLCWIPLFTIPYVIFERKIIYGSVVILFFIEGFISLCHFIVIKGPLTASSLFVLSNTNINEAKEFIELKFSFLWFLIIPYIFLFIIAIRNVPPVSSVAKNKLIIGLVLLLSFSFLFENILNERLIRKGVPQTIEAFISFGQELDAYKSLKERKVSNIKASRVYDGSKEHVFVLILGESLNRNHMSLYNYKRKTNPRLEKRNDLVVYKDVVSSHSNTLSSVLAIMTESNLENKINIDESVSLIDVFHSAGYKTYWLSNQSPIGIWDNGIYNLARTSDVSSFVNNIGNSSFESTYLASYDEKLFAPLNSALKERIENKFIVLHLMGSHSNYSKRYPSEYDIFSDKSSREQKIISEYDNSVLYNDFIVDSILNTLNNYCSLNPNAGVSAIYISDHGENVYDENNNVGHDYSGTLPKSNVEIPFLVWLSKNYANNNTGRSNLITANTNVPFVVDDLFHAIIDLNNIECGKFEKQRSLFNPEYNSRRLRILEDNQDYDLK